MSVSIRRSRAARSATPVERGSVAIAIDTASSNVDAQSQGGIIARPGGRGAWGVGRGPVGRGARRGGRRLQPRLGAAATKPACAGWYANRAQAAQAAFVAPRAFSGAASAAGPTPHGLRPR